MRHYQSDCVWSSNHKVENFSDRLRRIRTERQLSQAELARASGLSQGAISSYETGSRKSTTGIVDLAKALKVNPVWLLTGEGPVEPVAFRDSSYTLPAQLKDVTQPDVAATWPFKSIPPADYWTLPESSRRVIEETVAAMIRTMRDNAE